MLHFQFKVEFLSGKIHLLGNVYHHQVHLLEKDELVSKTPHYNLRLK
jgi:hypothetical protein